MNPDVVLDSMISEWEEALGESRFIDGNEYPNIADLVKVFVNEENSQIYFKFN